MFAIETVSCRAADAPQRFVRSLGETGFAVLTDHPIAPAAIERLREGWAAFFASPEKTAWLAHPTTQAGFFPYRSENAKGRTVKDLKEFYHVYPDGPVPAAVEASTRRIYDELVALGLELLGWIEAESPAEVRARYSEPLVRMLDGSRHNLFRILHYPPLGPDVEPAAERAAAHEDINLITLLIAGSEAGLEALDRAGHWHAVPCDAGMITVNVGDMLEMASGGWFPSTTHRVVNPPAARNVSRYAMPMFLHPRPEVMLSATMSADDYLQQRLSEIGLKR